MSQRRGAHWACFRVATEFKPAGAPATGLSNSIVNPDAVIGILGQSAQEFPDFVAAYSAGSARGVDLDPQTIGYLALDPGFIADVIIHVIDQPLGVTLSEVVLRATGDHYVL